MSYLAVSVLLLNSSSISLHFKKMDAENVKQESANEDRERMGGVCGTQSRASGSHMSSEMEVGVFTSPLLLDTSNISL